jgi:hypothetical protein
LWAWFVLAHDNDCFGGVCRRLEPLRWLLLGKSRKPTKDAGSVLASRTRMSMAPLWPGNALVFTRSCSSWWRARARAVLSFARELSHRNCAGCTSNTLIAIAQLCVQIDLLRCASRTSRTPSWVRRLANRCLPLSDYHGVSCREMEPLLAEEQS